MRVSPATVNEQLALLPVVEGYLGHGELTILLRVCRRKPLSSHSVWPMWSWRRTKAGVWYLQGHVSGDQKKRLGTDEMKNLVYS